MNLKVFLLVRAHLNSLTSNSVSKIPFYNYHCMLQRFSSNHKCPCRLFGDMPQVPMDPLTFMVALLSMFDVVYQLWKGGIAYAQRLSGDMDYDRFSEDRLMSPFPIGVCTFSIPFFFYLAYHVCGNT